MNVFWGMTLSTPKFLPSKTNLGQTFGIKRNQKSKLKNTLRPVSFALNFSDPHILPLMQFLKPVRHPHTALVLIRTARVSRTLLTTFTGTLIECIKKPGKFRLLILTDGEVEKARGPNAILVQYIRSESVPLPSVCLEFSGITYPFFPPLSAYPWTELVEKTELLVPFFLFL